MPNHHRSLDASAPAASAGREWLAKALLEAPDVDGEPGEWVAIEAMSVNLNPERLSGPISTRHAKHNPGWYRVQWFDSGRLSVFTEPVRLEGDQHHTPPKRRWG